MQRHDHLLEQRESATHRKGPRPSQNCGRMYNGTKPPISKAFSTPTRFACARIALP
jgi:hypothetical protein